MDAYKTTESRALKLKPGKYTFGSFTFDFPFAVNLEGKLEFDQSLDQCVEGRGTQTLTDPPQPDLSVWRPARLPVSVEERYPWPRRLTIC